ncbi:hypothetical protein WJX73_009749 [Symbiochloris irregularis]|uniref:Uncharacterized protein n=1 Tax=Symbiochloris irregularis TaxID=706552 RepID=A0AAW1P0D5_9CHLO
MCQSVQPQCEPAGLGAQSGWSSADLRNGPAGLSLQPVTVEDVQRVHYQVELCLLHLYTKAQTAFALQQLGTPPAFVCIVWDKLEEQNAEFFKLYNSKLALQATD